MENNNTVTNDKSIEELNAEREAMLQELLESGEYSSMTECAYGKYIADKELEQKVKNGKRTKEL